MIYVYIDEQRVNVPVIRLCHALGVSTSGYYAWQRRGPSRRALANEALLVHLRAIRVETRETYGSPRMHAELVARSGVQCESGRTLDAPESSAGAPQAARSSEDDLPGFDSPGRPQSAGPRFHGGRSG